MKLRDLLILHGAVSYGSSVQQPFEHTLDNPHIRDVKVGQLNFMHTTDTHGWLGSHLLQSDYDADWGDFVTFVSKFKSNRLDETQDFILIDTGDKHDGNGLSDATVPNGIETTKIFNQQDYDLLTLGNHELYTEENSILEYYSTAISDKFKNKYVSSNVEFIKEDGERVPFGNKFLYFTTKNSNIRVLVFSFMFDFRRYNSRANVVPVLTEVSKRWFQDATKTYDEHNVDIIVVFGHMPVTDLENHEINNLHSHLRKTYPQTIIQYFGGHSHIRDFASFDDKSTGLQSGRFAETVGFLSIDNVTSESPVFSRRYIDFNKRSFLHHTGDTVINDESKGRHISKELAQLRKKYQLDNLIGQVPQTYYMSARPLESEENIYNLITHHILPRLFSNITNTSMSRYIMINTGAVRYDLYEGPFTIDSEFIVLPFPNEWKYLELPLKVASKIEPYLNKGPSIASLAPPHIAASYLPNTLKACPFIRQPFLTEGYTTKDDFGCKGDDTTHNSQAEFYVPNVVQSEELLSANPDDTVHFIFYSFLQSNVLRAVNAILSVESNSNVTYVDADCKDYGGNSTKDLLRDYIKENTLSKI